jgi:uncharacterized damage-inducible protein DinB
MRSPEMLLKMFDYNYRTNQHLLTLAAKVTPDQWTATLESGMRGLHETLFHLLIVEEEWLYFCEQGTPRFDYRLIGDYADVESLRTFADQLYQAYRPYLARLDEDGLSARVTGEMPEPDSPVRSPRVWHLLMHMLYHSAQHRSEVAMMLTRYGHSPGDIDFYGFEEW